MARGGCLPVLAGLGALAFLGGTIASAVAGSGGKCGYLAGLWDAAGGPPSAARTMAGIAMAESGGDATAINHNSNGTDDYGLWQINSVNGGGPVSLVSVVNARQAVAVYRKQGLSAWSTYNSGAAAGRC